MNRILKLFATLVAGLVIIAVVAALVLPKVFDPNDYQDDIAKLVYDNTGMTLAINGPIGWSVFPWLGLSLEKVSVKGSGEGDLAKLGKAEVSVKLLPLLSKKVEMKAANLVGLELNLIKDESGKGNWVVEKKKTTAAAISTGEQPETQSSESTPIQLDIANVFVEDLIVRYEDRSTGNIYLVDQAGLETGSIRNQEPFDFNLKARISGNNPELVLKTSISGNLRFDLKQGVYTLKNLDISAQPDVQNAEKLSLVGQINVQQEPLMVKGELDVTQFNPGKLLKEIKIKLPPMADPKAMTSLSFKSQFNTDGKSFSADKLDLTLDSFRIDGFFKIADLEKQNMVFQFKGNDLNLDNYLPPPAQETAAKKPSSGEQKPAPGSGPAQEAPLIPEDALRPLNLKGSLELNSLTVAKLRFDKPTVKLKAANGRQEVKLSSGFYEGTIDVDGKLDVRTKGNPKVASTAGLKGINLSSLAQPIKALEPIEGLVNADLDITTSGQLQSVLTKNLNGKVNFAIDKGAFKSANFDKMVCEGIAKIRNKDLQKSDWGNSTQFKNLSGHFVIKNGVANNKDLTAALNNLNLKGDGYVNLVQQSLDYHVGLNVSGDRSPDSDPACQVNEDYADVTWPVRCQGTLGQQSCGIDTERLTDTIASLAKKEAKKRIEKEIEKKAGPLKDVLKGFFK